MIEKYRAVIQGIRPLLHSRYPLDESQLGKKARKSTVFIAERDAKKCLYMTTDGKIYQPAEHLEGALIKGAAQIPWKGKKSFKDIVAQSVMVMPREIPFKVPADAKYTIDITTCVNQTTRGRLPVARPRWDEWEFEFTIINENTDDLDGGTLRNILEEAGKIGIGTFRLKYGKFIVKDFQKNSITPLS